MKLTVTGFKNRKLRNEFLMNLEGDLENELSFCNNQEEIEQVREKYASRIAQIAEDDRERPNQICPGMEFVEMVFQEREEKLDIINTLFPHSGRRIF